MTSSGMCSAAAAAGTGSGTSSSTTDPGASTSRARMSTPSRVTRPSEMSRWTWAREIPDASATNLSARPDEPVAGTSTRTTVLTGGRRWAAARRRRRRRGGRVRVASQPRAQQPDDQQQHDRDADGRIGHVEGVEARIADARVDPIHHVTVPHAVQEVPDGPAEEQAEGDRQQHAVDTLPRLHPQDDRDDPQARDAQERRGRAQEPEDATVVLGSCDPDEVTHDRGRGAR